MNTHSRWAALGATLALSVIPGLARAYTTQQMNETFTRPVAGGCTYQGSIVGSVTKHNRIGLVIMNRDRYDADVAIEGTVSCPGTAPVAVERGQVRVQNASIGTFERRLEATGRATVRNAGNVCTVTPDFEVRHGHVYADSTFHESCIPSIGGGPRNY